MSEKKRKRKKEKSPAVKFERVSAPVSRLPLGGLCQIDEINRSDFLLRPYKRAYD